MILSNVEIVNALESKDFAISDLAGTDPSLPPFNTSAVDLRLRNEIMVPSATDLPAALDLRKPGIARFWAQHSTPKKLESDQPYTLIPSKFILALTHEIVSFPFLADRQCYSARVEGKSSLARCGLLIHFTAPTIHAGFSGPIALEIINFGTAEVLLYPLMFICQLIIEEVRGLPTKAPNRFTGQINPAGEVVK